MGKRFLKVTGSIAAAVGLVFLGNVFSGQQLVQGMNARGDNDFYLEDRGVDVLSDGLALHTGGKGKAPAGGEFAWYFNRDLGAEGRDKANLTLSRESLAAALSDGPGHNYRKDPSAQAGDKLKDGKEYLGLGRAAGGFGGKAGNAPASPPPAAYGLEAEKLSKADSDDRRMTRTEDSLKRLGEGEDKSGSRVNLVSRNGGSRVADPAPAQETRKIIRNGDVSLEVESYEATYTKLAEFVAAEKGQIASANTQKMANGKVQATVTLRIPPERFEAVIAKLKDFGTIRNQRIGSEDVTKAYIDLETRLKSKEILAERLRKLLAEGKGTVKELMEVEVQAGATNEAIEQIKGELKYYDNLVGMSTITLRISEKDLGQPFEYVQTLTSNIAVTAKDPDDSYAKAQKEITDAGGQVVDSKMTRQSDGTSIGTIRGRVDAEKFPALREALKKLGTVTNDTVNQQKTARGGHEGSPKADAPLRKEQAIVDVTVSSPPIFVTKRSQILIETDAVESAYQNSRRAIEAAGGKIVDGSLTGRSDGMSATLRAQVDADKFAALVESLKTAGKVKNANVNSILPSISSEGGPQLLRERAEIELALISPPQLIGEEHGIVKTIRDTFANSWAGLLWSIEKLFVGISLAGPWLALLFAAILIWRRARKKKAAQPAP